MAPLPDGDLLNLTPAEKRQKLMGLILPMLVIIWILGSIYGGIFTPTEASAVAI